MTPDQHDRVEAMLTAQASSWWRAPLLAATVAAIISVGGTITSVRMQIASLLGVMESHQRQIDNLAHADEIAADRIEALRTRIDGHIDRHNATVRPDDAVLRMPAAHEAWR